MQRTVSNRLYEEAKNYFPGGVNSPVRAFKSVHGSPIFISKADGAYMYDEDDNKYIDFCCSWGPLIHGHNHPHIKEAVLAAIENGLSFGAPSEIGNKIGKLIIENHQYIDKLRFVSSGTEAVMSAIRLARGYTGKNKIIKFEGCYHGHVDSLLVKAGSGLATFGVSTSAGVPDSFVNETLVFPLNDLCRVEEVMQENADEIAAIILEPIPANNGLLLQDTTFLVWLRKLCDDHDILLIFDEVISGFRIGFEGAAGYYHVEPDLLTFGKIIGGGMPVGAFGGKSEIMSMIAPEGPVYQAGTLSANPIALSAGYAALKLLIDPEFYINLNQKTEDFTSNINAYCLQQNYPCQVVQIGSIFWLNFSNKKIQSSDQIDPESMETFKFIHAYLLENGIYLGPSGYEVGFISSAHTPEILSKASKLICQALDLVFSVKE